MENTNNGFPDQRPESQNDQRLQNDLQNNTSEERDDSGEFGQYSQENSDADYDNEAAGNSPKAIESETAYEDGNLGQDNESDDLDSGREEREADNLPNSL